jgi:hypothetical protein
MKYIFLWIAFVLVIGACHEDDPEIKKIGTSVNDEKFKSENLAFDVDDDSLDGGKKYSLHLPSDLPVASWSVTAYEVANSSGSANGQLFSSLKMTDQPVINSDSSVDLYLSPTSPPGMEKNWLRTVKGKKYFVIIRFYNPEKEFFENAWKSGGIKKIK